MAKEYVFEFSGPITLTNKVKSYINIIVKALGGKRFYIEYNKIVVVI